ncbi:MAG: ABC transporter ATP-binding protein/permease, partial [Terrimicrobiaceae bacterium]|nr:ABC transporter ATP-binding protein/permease [Terrimicrobiaceae bacterium]
MPKPSKMPLPQLLRALYRPYLRLAGYLRPYRGRFAMGMAFGVVAGMLNGVIPLVIKTVGEKVLPGGAGSEAALLGAAAAADAGGPRMGEVVWLAMLIPAVMVTRGVFSYLNAYCLAWVSFRVLRDVRTRLFAHIISQSLDFFNQAKAGRLISRVVNDTRMAQNALVSIAGDIVKNPIAVITGIAVLVGIDWKFSLTTLVLFPICMVPVAVFGRKVRQAGRAEENEAGTMAVILQESFAGVRGIKSFAREEHVAREFAKSCDTQCRNSMRVRKSIDIVQPLIESVSAFGVVLAILYVYFFDISVAKFIALCAGIFLLYNPVKSLSKIPMLMQKCLASSTAIFELFEREPTVRDSPGATVLDRAEGRIEFRNVTFSYHEGQPAVRGVTLSIQPGQRFALVGASGAGKSTLLSLLLRFYEPQEGVILVDGRDIRSITQRSLREAIGVVTQETFLFHETIRANIRFGRLEATDEEIMTAARLAHAHDFIMAQPRGYDTLIGDKGCLLSGGQQQRLAIARALLKNAPILLLDEATSALDSESERAIQDALERLARGRTVIAIAHRLSTVLNSDAIVVMEAGRVVDIGP